MVFLSIVASAVLNFSTQQAAPLFASTVYGNPKYSPDEQHLAYLAPDERGAYNIWVDGKLITKNKKSIFNFQWEKDSSHLLYGYDEKGDENTHLFRVDLEGIIEDLTPLEDRRAGLLFPTEKPIVSLNLKDSHFFDFYRINTKTRERELILPERERIAHIALNKKGDPKALIEFEESGRKFLEIEREGTWKRLWELSPDDWLCSIYGFSKDEKKIRIISSRGLPARGLFEIDIETGESTLLFADPKFDCGNFFFNPVTDQLQAAFIHEEMPKWHFFDGEFEKEIRKIEEKLDKGYVILLSRMDKDKKWFVSQRRDDHPTVHYLWHREEERLEKVLEESPELSGYDFGSLKPFSFQASDGTEIPGYLLVPPVGHPPYPTVVQAHGGPHFRYEYAFFPELQYFAKQGYAVLIVNYRGSDGYGSKFLMADHGQWGEGRMLQDIIEGKRWAVEQGWVDPKKIIIRGASMGGYFTLLALCKFPNEFNCGISICPVVEPELWMPEEYVKWDYMREQWYRLASYGSKTPVQMAGQIKDPLLMLHGDNDLRVNLLQSKRMTEALKEHGIPFTFHTIKNDGHVFIDPDNRLFSLKTQSEFINRYINAR